MLPFRLANAKQQMEPLPLVLYSIGSHEQPYLKRPLGYPAHQILISFYNSGVFRFEDKAPIILPPNQFIFIPKGINHEYYPLNDIPWTNGYLGFNGGAAEAILASFEIPALQPIALNRIHFIETELTELWQAVERNGVNAIHYYSKQIYTFMLTLGEEMAKPNRQQKSQLNAADFSLQKAVNFMHEHFNEPLQMKNLASAIGYSVQHFQRIFLLKYAITPHAYLQKIRLEQSIQWLKQEEDITIKTIAERLQWEPNYFIRVFKNQYGVSPGRYRENG